MVASHESDSRTDAFRDRRTPFNAARRSRCRSSGAQIRQGYPFAQAVRTPTRANRAGTADVLLDLMGDVRQPNLHTLDLRIDKVFRLARGVEVTPSMDVFNLGNVNTVLARRRLQSASNANLVSAIVAPRVARFGVRVTW